MKAGARHSANCFIVFHELFPYEAGAGIFRHKNGDAQIDAEHIGAVPIDERIEGVYEAIVAESLLAEIFPHVAQNAQCLLRQEWQGARGGARNYRAIDAPHFGRAAPSGVAANGVGGTDPPQVFAVIRELLSQFEAP